MDGNSKSKNRESRTHRARRAKNSGSRTYSSSDEDFHSDDNLRPYEEVKIAHHDKKLSGLVRYSRYTGWPAGAAPPSVMAYGACPLQQCNADQSPTMAPDDMADFYNYASAGSDGDIETDYGISSSHPRFSHRQKSTNASHHHIDSESSSLSSSAGLASSHLKDANVCAKLSDSDGTDQETATIHYGHAGTLQLPPPSLPPPPPPPPIEDIPQRSPVASTRRKSFGPSQRGNYSEVENTCRRCNYSEGEGDFEQHYLVQTTSSNVFLPPDAQPRFPRTVPPARQGSVGQGQYQQVSGSDYPRHFQNGDPNAMNQATLDRHTYTFPQFAATATTVTTYPPPPQDYTVCYSKFSNASHRVKKQLKQRCSWKCMALLLLIISVALLACVAYFAAMLVFEEKERVANDASPQYIDGAFNTSRGSGGGYSTAGGGSRGSSSTTALPSPSIVHLGQLQQLKIPPKSFWQSKFEQLDPGFIKINFTIPDHAVLGIYGRKNLPPTHVQFEFFEIFSGSRLVKRSLSWRDSPGKNTAIIQYLTAGVWYFAIYNDNNKPQKVAFVTNVKGHLDTNCLHDCYHHGECKNKRCICYPGYSGKYCGQNTCPVLCNGNGYYNEGLCQCHPGWKGQECEIPANACEVPDCNGNGECVHGQCICNNGYKGPDCSVLDCINNCSSNGLCSLGRCICFQGYKGPSCNQQDIINLEHLCSKDCSGHGTYNIKTDQCNCDWHFTGEKCETEVCLLDCFHGYCENKECVCHNGWTGPLCDMLACDPRCDSHGFCNNGTCICKTGWNGKHCTLDGCPGECNGNGDCQKYLEGWKCSCNKGWKGKACDIAIESACEDRVDNDKDGLRDCQDPDCCDSRVCKGDSNCKTSPDPLDILLRKQSTSTTASFFEKMKFLIENNSVQTYATRHAFNESQVSVISGSVLTRDGSSLIGVRVGVVTQPLYGYTFTRAGGRFDILVNGGGSVTLQFNREPFPAQSASVLVPWNQIITMDTVIMTLEDDDWIAPNPILCNVEHQYYLLRPVVLSTWQHTQLGACPEKTTIIPESQVLQESLSIPHTNVHLVYHSSESAGYMSVILIQMTPSRIPESLAVVHLRVSVEGIVMEKVFEADPNLKYTFSWNRRNVYRQKVYGIVTARVFVGYQYQNCHYIFWEARSTTMSGYDLTSSEIGGWNLDIHHTYNFQEGILHKGDGTNIYLKEKPKKLVNILGNGSRRKLLGDNSDGKALDKQLLAPVALASGLDGSLYVGDYNLIRKLSPSREEVASILQMSTSSIAYKYYMTVSPVDGRLYISDSMSHKILRVKTMGPVRRLEENFEVIAGNGEECTPGETALCGDGSLAVKARLSHPKGIAINKDGVIYFADGPNIRHVSTNGRISTLIGSQELVGKWTPLPCDEIVSADKVSLRWPTALAIDPLDDTLHILDNKVVLKFTLDKKLIVVAGRQAHCPLKQTSFLPTGILSDDEQASSIANHVSLSSPESMTFSPHGDLYIVESDSHQINRVRVVTTDGRIHHFAGAKSKCDCEKPNCKCYDSKETLAAQALLYTPTSITVTPDGVMHIADMGNLRLYSIVSELPQPNLLNQYEVMSPETQELYIFNKNGQHQYSINIMTNLFMYNYTYSVNSFYGKLVEVSDAAGNRIQIKRSFDLQAQFILAPDGSKCKINTDNIYLLHRFIAPDNKSSTFKYLPSSGLLVSKHMSNGKTYFYEYDMMGRLLKGSQPTGEITSLETDVNTTGSIVHVTTDSSDAVALATYGRVQSVLHGAVQTKVTYLPDGAVVIVFPSNLTVALETRGHPILESKHRMHFKRKMIIPNLYVHRLEWRFYLDRSGRPKQNRLLERIGRRLRVGPYFSRHASMHGSHDDGYKGKALLINGVNLLTVEYNRETNTETVMDKSMRDILTVVYDNTGLPTHFLPNTGHNDLNISYTRHGAVEKWQYGELTEQRMYEKGMMVEKISTNGAQYRYIYSYGLKPTDIILPSGKQYRFHYDSEGNLISVTMPSLGVHRFAYVTSIRFQRYLYYPPKAQLPFIKDIDGNGKLRQILYPSERKRVIYRYNNHFQPVTILFDDSHISYGYDSQTGKLNKLEAFYTGYGCQYLYYHSSTLISSIEVQFQQDRQLIGAKSFYNYDNNFRLTYMHIVFTNNETTSTNFSYNTNTGKLANIKQFKVNWPLPDREIISDENVKINREYDHYGRLKDIEYKFIEAQRFKLEINYDHTNRIHEWRRKIGHVNSEAVEYVYDIDNNVIDVLIDDKRAWHFGYDANGNIAKITTDGRTKELHFDEADHIKKYGEKYYKFDPDGFMVQRNKEHLYFNSLGQLRSVTKTEEYKVFFSYDPIGRLVVFKDLVGNVLQYFYLDVEHPERITHTYNHGNGDTTQYHYDELGHLVSMERRGNSYYIANDPTGTPLVVFDIQGNVMKQMSYDPLGSVTSDTNPHFEFSFGFQGGIHNPITKLLHIRNRVYDPQIGRWVAPDFSNVFEKVKDAIEKPEVLNIYQYHLLVNLHTKNRKYPLTDLADWLLLLGYDVRSLAPDVTYTGEIRGHKKGCHDVELLPTSSAFECTFRRDMDNLLMMSTVSSSKITPKQPTPVLKPAHVPFILGNGIILSVVDERVLVNFVDNTPEILRKTASVLLNNSDIIDMHFTIKGKAIHYFVKVDTNQADMDLGSLNLRGKPVVFMENGINITVHKIQHTDGFHARSHEEIDIRLHGNYSIMNIRYGTDATHEKHRVLQHAKERAVMHAWAREKYWLQNSLPSEYLWSEQEKYEIKTVGYAEGYIGIYIRNPEEYPELADDCNNIRLLKRTR
ncbi:teneurin-m isoform X3 [Octopus sinensis]|uniref:Teneurin-m isoform X3 n=1 Tax=Octopus sinensis TaxID=2607531 RepID=A0A6P7SLN0_9MOLL|nr:teneurin-m isoform X3 [Octopus sinensis]